MDNEVDVEVYEEEEYMDKEHIFLQNLHSLEESFAGAFFFFVRIHGKLRQTSLNLPGIPKNPRRRERLQRGQKWLQDPDAHPVSDLKTKNKSERVNLHETIMLLSIIMFVLSQCFTNGVHFPRLDMFHVSLMLLFIEVFMLYSFGRVIVEFFKEFMALDDIQSEAAAIPEADDYEDLNSDIEDEIFEEEEENLDSKEEMTHEELISQQTDEEIKENEHVLKLEKENLEKAQIIEELRNKLDALTEVGDQMERIIRDLERQNEEKDRKINLMPAEMERLRKEIAEKNKETENLIKEKEDRDSTLIILESTVSVLEIERETLNYDLQKMESDRNATKVQLKKFNEDLQRLREENECKRNQFESLLKENEDKSLRIDCLEHELEVLTIEKQRADDNLQQLEECRREIAERTKEVEKMKDLNLQKDREILRLQNDCSLKQKEVIGLLKESKSVVADKANGKLTEMTRRKVQLEFELPEMKEELETMEFEKMETIVELESLQEKNSAKDQRIISLETEVRILQEEKRNKTMKELGLLCKENEMLKIKTNVVKKVPEEQPLSEKKTDLDKTRCLRRPQINCKDLYRQMNNIEEGINQLRALGQPSAGTRKDTKKVLTKTPSLTKPNQKPKMSRKELHQKMRLESAARLQRLEQESQMVKNLYKINSVT
ncbi:myosin heavy chain, clone 203-like [Macrobrachium rosenbergii]|uniref:myosin heavy chain, clone 203-like n=1 Tax=Macrobrachium rosenbergii TaxID=79674 RepID=UPI0034D5E85B